MEKIFSRTQAPDIVPSREIQLIKDIFRLLQVEFGERWEDWWPADSAFERVAGAILVQQTRWESVEKVLGELKRRNLIDPKSLVALPEEELQDIIRPVGFNRQKARYLHGIAEYFSKNPLDSAIDMPADRLRKELLSLEGVGDETADVLLLYVAGKPKFVVDAYARRMFGCIGLNGSYRRLQGVFEQALGDDLQAYRQYHGQIVEHGKRYCNKNRCDECAIARYFPR